VPSLLEQDFFDLPKTKRSIHELAETESLVLFLGSGLSASQGLPVWYQLLRRLLDKAAAEHPDLNGEEAKEEFVQTLLKTTEPTILGSIVRGLYPAPEAFVDALSTAIYSESLRLGGPRSASNFTQAVWELIFTRRQRKKKTVIITTNYDDVLESALTNDVDVRSLGQSLGIAYAIPIHGEHQFLAHRDTALDEEHAVVVHHIHGYLPADATERVDAGNIVLSARDYGQSWEAHWSYELLSPHWRDDWLFIGMSFHDPHITFFLRARNEHLGDEKDRVNEDNPPRGVFSLQGQPWASLSESAKLGLARAEVSRLRELGMKALPTLYFFQDAQFLREIALRAESGDKYQPYVARRTQWAWEFSSERLSSEEGERAKGLLQDVHRTLLEVRARVEDIAPHEDERFKIELWCRDPDDRCLFQLGSSESVSGEPDRARRYALSSDLPIAAVQALTAGAATTSTVPLSAASRWQYYFGFPISLSGQPWYELPVGALVIAGTAPETSSALHTQRATLEARIEEWAAGVVKYLDPRSEWKAGLGSRIARLLP